MESTRSPHTIQYKNEAQQHEHYCYYNISCEQLTTNGPQVISMLKINSITFLHKKCINDLINACNFYLILYQHTSKFKSSYNALYKLQTEFIAQSHISCQEFLTKFNREQWVQESKNTTDKHYHISSKKYMHITYIPNKHGMTMRYYLFQAYANTTKGNLIQTYSANSACPQTHDFFHHILEFHMNSSEKQLTWKKA